LWNISFQVIFLHIASHCRLPAIILFMYSKNVASRTLKCEQTVNLFEKREDVCFSCHLRCGVTGLVTGHAFNRDQLNVKQNSMGAESFAILACVCTIEFNSSLFSFSLFYSFLASHVASMWMHIVSIRLYTLRNCPLSLIPIQDIGIKITLEKQRHLAIYSKDCALF